MSGRGLQSYSLCQDVFRHLVHSTFLGEKLQWAEKVKYLGVSLDRMLSLLLNKRSGLSTKNGLMLY